MNELISKETVLQLQKILTPLVAKIGEGGTFIFNAYYRQVFVDALQFGIFFLICVIVFIFCLILLKQPDPEKKYTDVSAFIFIISVSVFLLGFGFIFQTLSRLINPNYFFIQKMLEMIK